MGADSSKVDTWVHEHIMKPDIIMTVVTTGALLSFIGLTAALGVMIYRHAM